MAAPTGSLWAIHSDTIEERISRSIMDLAPTIDPVFRGMILSDMDVKRADDIGRDFKVLKTFGGGLAGVIDGGISQGDFALYGDRENSIIDGRQFLQGVSSYWPDAFEGPNQRLKRFGFGMRSTLTNLALTLSEMNADSTPAHIKNYVAPKISGFALNMAQHIANFFWTSQNDFYRLTYLGTASGAWSKTVDSNRTLEVDLTKSNYTVNRFMRGMRVQIYDTTGVTLRASTTNSENVWIVVGVDRLAGKVRFRLPTDNASEASIANGDIIVPARIKGASGDPFTTVDNQYFTGFAGINSWLKTGAAGQEYLLGAERDTANQVNVNVDEEFKSMGYSFSNAPITEHKMRMILARWNSAMSMFGYTIDTLVASEGVWLAYHAQRIQKEILDRTGVRPVLDKEGGPGEFKFEHDGRTYTGYTSSYVDANTVYGIKRKNNWTIHVPPEDDGFGRSSEVAGKLPFRFVAPKLTGLSTNQIPHQIVVNNTTRVTEGVQMPGWLRMQISPTQIPGLKLTNVAEDRLYSDS